MHSEDTKIWILFRHMLNEFTVKREILRFTRGMFLRRSEPREVNTTFIAISGLKLVKLVVTFSRSLSTIKVNILLKKVKKVGDHMNTVNDHRRR